MMWLREIIELKVGFLKDVIIMCVEKWNERLRWSKFIRPNRRVFHFDSWWLSSVMSFREWSGAQFYMVNFSALITSEHHCRRLSFYSRQRRKFDLFSILTFFLSSSTSSTKEKNWILPLIRNSFNNFSFLNALRCCHFALSGFYHLSAYATTIAIVCKIR